MASFEVERTVAPAVDELLPSQTHHRGLHLEVWPRRTLARPVAHKYRRSLRKVIPSFDYFEQTSPSVPSL
jgi:hypothetical protein